MSTNKLDISLTKAQAEFLALDCYYPAYVAGRGSGKSYIMGFRAVLNVKESKNAVVCLYQPSHELIRQVSVPNVEYWLQELCIEYKPFNSLTHEIVTKKYGKLLFKSFENTKLLIGYQSSAAHIDELDTVDVEKAKEVWKLVISRNRLNLDDAPDNLKEWSDKNSRLEYINRSCVYSSPEGFKFCYNMWGINSNPAYKMVKGSVRDNPALSEAFIREQIKDMSQNEIDAYIDGEFRNMQTGSVYSAFDKVEHRSYESIQSGETLYIGIDFNVRHGAAAVFVKRNEGLEWHLVDELFNTKNTFETIEKIQFRWQTQGHKIIVYPDCSGGYVKSSAKSSDIALLEEANFIVRARKKNPYVKDRVQAANKAFRSKRFFINATQCIVQQCYDRYGEPDKKSGHDHMNDAATYPIAYELPVKKLMFNINVAFPGADHTRKVEDIVRHRLN